MSLPMKEYVIGGDVFEIVDQSARDDIDVLQIDLDKAENNIKKLQTVTNGYSEDIKALKLASITPDTSLGIAGAAADSKTVGDAINAVENEIDQLNEQISEQIDVIKTDMLTVDITDVEQGSINLINADTVGGILPSNFVLDSELDTYKNEVSNSYLLKTGTASNSTKFNGYTYNTLKSMILDLAHPIGSYYWSSESTNPSNLFGGTWTQVKDRFVLAAGSSYSVGATGGAATVTLTVDQIPSHSHTVHSRSIYSDGGNFVGFCNEDNSTNSYVTGSKGGGEAHNNMPPYIVAYCWRRTA